MGDPLWRSMEAGNFERKQLELVIQKKKVQEVYDWFRDHFVDCSTAQYVARCPIVILQGPTGCGKTSTLKWISTELKIPIREYSETTDITDINHELHYQSFDTNEDGGRKNLSQSIDRRKALKFEHFIIDKILYNQLYPTIPSRETLAQEDSEFESDDEFGAIIKSANNNNSNGNTNVKQQRPPWTGVIFHIDTPLTFVRSQRILIQTLMRLIKVIREISPKLLRRAAIVFETLEGEGEIISLSTKVKSILKIKVLKFNPIVQTNMKKFAESLIEKLRHITIDKATIDQIVTDSDGDIRACINTLQLICNKSPGLFVFKQINHNSMDGNAFAPPHLEQAIKKQKVIHEKVRQIELDPSLMRDNTRSPGFFHVLGKIFYQKRLYPHLSYNHGAKSRLFRSKERPFPTENSTEYLANLLDVDPKNLIAWLHQHYYNFCRDSNIDKAAMFMDNMSDADTVSLNSTQSSQFYEMHHAIDQLQTHVTIEATTYSLYEDQTNTIKDSHKKARTNSGLVIISSVENLTSNAGKLYSFNKPVSMNVPKLMEDYQTLLQYCRAKLIDINGKSIDPLKILLDYVPYINLISDNWASMSPGNRRDYFGSDVPELYSDANAIRVIKTLNHLEAAPDSDLEKRHESLLEMIEEIEISQSREALNTMI